MKEIDFLPEWYRSGRRRQISYRTQYVALAGLFAVMMAWNFVSMNALSKASAELAQMTARDAEIYNRSREFDRVKEELRDLQKEARIIDEADSRIPVANVLAEMSHLFDERIIVSKVDFVAERFAQEQKQQAGGDSVVRVASSKVSRSQTLPLGKVRFKVVLAGQALDPNDVAELMCKLEDSAYFCSVYLSFSRNRSIERLTGSAEQRRKGPGLSGMSRPAAGPADERLQVAEFEITCYLANYRKEQS